eukprot:6488197-Amphidinium_carterae.1
MEKTSNEEYTQDRFTADKRGREWLEKLSAQIKAILISLCTEEPLSIVVNTTRGPQGGLEALRRLNNRYDPLGQRAAKNLLSKILQTRPVAITQLRREMEQLERWEDEYHTRTGTDLQEDLKMLALEQLVQEPLKTHLSLNSERLSSYTLLRQE